MKTVYFCRLFVTYVDVSYISWQVETVDAKKKKQRDALRYLHCEEEEERYMSRKNEMA